MNKQLQEEKTEKKRQAITDILRSIECDDRLSFSVPDKTEHLTLDQYADYVSSRPYDGNYSGHDDYALFDLRSHSKNIQESNYEMIKKAIEDSGLSRHRVSMSPDYYMKIPVEFILQQWGVRGDNKLHFEKGSSLMSMIQLACSSIPVNSEDFIYRLNIDSSQERNSLINHQFLVGKTINPRYLYESFRIELRVLLESLLISFNEYNSILKRMASLLQYDMVRIESAEETGITDGSGVMYISLQLSCINTQNLNDLQIENTERSLPVDKKRDNKINISLSKDVIRYAFEEYTEDQEKFG